jgi:class 3 adenylate cyclase/tetratricopeptide (TPR) repeat protein
MNCPSCGAHCTTTRKFCGDCGAPLPWMCGVCGSENPPDKRFCGDCGHLTSDPIRPAKPQVLAGMLAGERRHLTVMFADLVGSTALGTRLDPEDFRAVIASFHGALSGLVTRFGGFIARYLGDGVLAYFGYPQAHEDDPERAVNCGLVMVQAVGNLDTLAGPPGTLRARVGIATGLVVVGHAIGSGSSLEVPVVGDTPNLAARLQAIALPGAVVIDESTRRLTGELFEARDLGPSTLKGWNEPIRAWAVLAESTVDSRFEALRLNRGSLVGRTEEIDMLLRRWKQVTITGIGRVVLLSGEPGIGKSRLVAALEKQIGDASFTLLRLFCWPHHQDSALYPVIRHLERVAGFRRGDSHTARLEKLRRLLDSSAVSPVDLPVFANLLSIPVERDHLQSTLAPQRLKEMTFAAIIRQLDNLAARAPVLTVFEDIHWADPTTLDLLDELIATVERMPMLLVVTTRPELQPPWAARANVTVRLLNALDNRLAAHLIADVSGGAALPVAVVNKIVSHADGIPLFIEELTKTVMQRGSLGSEGEPLPPSERNSPDIVPSSLHASLIGRLDRLAAGKEIAQIGSVIGREFSFEVLQDLSGSPPKRLQDAVRELVEVGIVLERGRPPDATFTFKHALVQDAAYGSMLRDQRRAIHLRLAELLTKDSDASVEPQLIAWHFAQAGAPDRSIDYYLKAAGRATGRFALAEMVSQLHEGLRQIEQIRDLQGKWQRELALQVALGRVLIDHQGGAGEQVCAAFERARELCLKLDDTAQLIRVHDGLTNYYFAHFELKKVLRSVNEMREVGRKTGNPQATLMAYRSGSLANLLLGRFDQAREELEQLIDIYTADRDGPHAALTARDPKVAACTSLGICLTVMGFPAAGAAMSQAGVNHAERLGHSVSLIFGLRRACLQYLLARDRQAVIDLSERLVTMSREYETFKGRIDGAIFYSWGQLQKGWDVAFLEQLLNGIGQLDAARNWILLPFFMASAAEMVGNYGDSGRATALLGRAAELVHLTGEHWCEPEIIRLQALFGASTPEEAASLLQTALETARKQGAKLWELRCATSLAKLWAGTGNIAAARAVLSPIYDWFTEGFETPDMVVAREVIQDIGRA